MALSLKATIGPNVGKHEHCTCTLLINYGRYCLFVLKKILCVATDMDIMNHWCIRLLNYSCSWADFGFGNDQDVAIRLSVHPGFPDPTD